MSIFTSKFFWKCLIKNQLTHSDPKRKGGGKCPPSCQLGQKQLLPSFSELQFFWPPCPDFINNLKLAPKINSQYVRWKFSHKLAYLGQLPTISSHKELSNTLTLKVKFLVKPNFFKLWNRKGCIYLIKLLHSNHL